MWWYFMVVVWQRAVGMAPSSAVDKRIRLGSPVSIVRDQYWYMQPEEADGHEAVRVHYSTLSTGKKSSGPPVVFLHGFGAGEFHWENNMAEIAEMTSRDCYALDWVGQGRSWPDESEGLRVGAGTWTYQLIQFLEEVVQEKAILVGNSLGGFIATFVSAKRPDLVAGVGLLNATPFWGFVSREFSLWDAALPAPPLAAAIGSAWFNALRNEKTVRSLLQQVYASPNALDDILVERIAAAAAAEKGPEVFTSILFSPPPLEPFDTALQTAYFQNDIPFALIMGKEDPWVSPIWGQRAFRRLKQSVPYYELSPSGHCCHHETPLATNFCLSDWLNSLSILRKDQSPKNEEETSDALSKIQKFNQTKVARLPSSLDIGESVIIQELDGRPITVTHVDGQPRTLLEQAARYVWG